MESKARGAAARLERMRASHALAGVGYAVPPGRGMVGKWFCACEAKGEVTLKVKHRGPEWMPELNSSEACGEARKAHRQHQLEAMRKEG